MKKKIIFLLFCSALLFTSLATSSCSRGYGCPTYGTKANINKKGEMSSQRGETNLFDKKMRKKI